MFADIDKRGMRSLCEVTWRDWNIIGFALKDYIDRLTGLLHEPHSEDIIAGLEERRDAAIRIQKHLDSI